GVVLHDDALVLDDEPRAGLDGEVVGRRSDELFDSKECAFFVPYREHPASEGRTRGRDQMPLREDETFGSIALVEESSIESKESATILQRLVDRPSHLAIEHSELHVAEWQREDKQPERVVAFNRRQLGRDPRTLGTQ